MNILLFALGALTMIIELAIPRLIAPAYGNTMFSWTAIIAVVLTAMTTGYYFGGRITERKKDQTYNIVILFSTISAAWTIALGLLGQTIVEYISFLNILTGPIVASIILAGVPTCLNAAAVPMIIAVRKETAGVASGNSFSVSTIGSIVGVIITGYLLLPLLGISGALFSGSCLVAIALLMNRKIKIGFLSMAMAIAGWLWISQIPLPPNTLIDYSNGYHRIRVITDPTKTPETRTLYLDNTIEGIIQTGMVTSYLEGITKLVDVLPEIKSALVIGGGAFAVPRYIKDKFPQARVDVAELDGAIEDVGYKYLELEDNLNILIGDGRKVLSSADIKYDLIINDAFKGYRNMPFHLTTKEFNDIVKGKLTANGLYAVNVRGYPTGSYLGASMVRTLGESFKYLSLMEPNASNTITLASPHRIDIGDNFTPSGKGIFLTDNKAPIEFLVIADLILQKIRI